jgi:hypothetical protein
MNINPSNPHWSDKESLDRHFECIVAETENRPFRCDGGDAQSGFAGIALTQTLAIEQNKS